MEFICFIELSGSDEVVDVGGGGGTGAPVLALMNPLKGCTVGIVGVGGW